VQRFDPRVFNRHKTDTKGEKTRQKKKDTTKIIVDLNRKGKDRGNNSI